MTLNAEFHVLGWITSTNGIFHAWDRRGGSISKSK